MMPGVIVASAPPLIICSATRSGSYESITQGVGGAGAAVEIRWLGPRKPKRKDNSLDRLPAVELDNVVGADPPQLIGKKQPVLFLGKIRRAAAAADHHSPILFFLRSSYAGHRSGTTQSFFGRAEQQRHGAPDAARLGSGEILIDLESFTSAAMPQSNPVGSKSEIEPMPFAPA